MQVRLFLSLERDVDEHVDRATGLLLIDERRVAFDESRVLESPHTPQASGFRQTDALRQLTVGDATVELQCPHDGSVISIQFRSQIQLHAGVSGGRVYNQCGILLRDYRYFT